MKELKNNFKTIYNVTISTLTPLHIGTGETLLRDYDFTDDGRNTYVLNQDKIFEHAFSRTGKVPTLPAGRLASNYRMPSPFVRYTLKGHTSVNEIHEQIKDVFGQCYIPGSSFKGALRTVLLAHAHTTKQEVARAGINEKRLRSGRYNSKVASDRFEHQAFRPKRNDANHDLLRALHIADSQPSPKSPSPLMLLHAQVFTGETPSAPIWIEAISRDQVFKTTITVDDWLLSPSQAEMLGWRDRTDWLRNISEAAHVWCSDHFDTELEFADAKELTAMSKVYQSLMQHDPGPGRFFLQLGWGSGWTGITIGPYLSPEEQFRAREIFELGKSPTYRGRWSPNPQTPFPNSRRLEVRTGQNVNAIPGAPLGWVLVEMKPK